MLHADNRIKEMKELILFTFFLLFVMVALYYSFSVFLYSLIGIGLGVLVSPLLTFFKHKLSLPRGLSAIILFFFFLLVLSGILYSIWYLVSDQITGLAQLAPQISENLEEKFTSFQQMHPWIQQKFQVLNVSETAKELLTRLFEGMRISMEVIAGLAFALIIGLYTAVSLPNYFQSILGLFPKSQKAQIENILHLCAINLRLWFSAQATDMALLGIITGLALWALGVEFWAVYGLMTTVFTIVPYIGILIVVFSAVLINLASDPSMVIWVLVVFGVTQQLEANVILPIIMKNQVQLPEVPLLIFILFLGVCFGLIGVFLAPPLFTVFKVLYTEIYLPNMKQR